jgi:hypothetical protein
MYLFSDIEKCCYNLMDHEATDEILRSFECLTEAQQLTSNAIHFVAISCDIDYTILFISDLCNECSTFLRQLKLTLGK